MTIKIDVEKLKKLLQERGIIWSELSRKLGYSSGHLSDVMRRGTISKPTLVAVCNYLSIDSSEIILPEPPEVEEPPVSEQEKPNEIDAMVIYDLEKLSDLLVAMNAKLDRIIEIWEGKQ